jgi:cytochrome c5
MKRVLIGITGIAALLTAGLASAADGKQVYTKSCAACHAGMPPKLGDKTAWEPRIKTGMDAMVAAVVKGKGIMPPKGGASTLSEADIKAAVEYMVSQVK